MQATNTPLTLKKVPADLPLVVAERDSFLPPPYNALQPDAAAGVRNRPHPQAPRQQPPAQRIPHHAPPAYHAPARPLPALQPVHRPAQWPVVVRQAAAPLRQLPTSRPKNRQLKFHLVMAGIFGALTVGSFMVGFTWSLIAPATDAWAVLVAVCWLLTVVHVPVWVIWGIARR